MRLAFRIALRFLTSNKGQTALIALGIAVGVSVQVFIGLLIQGLQQSLLDKTIGASPHITIVSNKDTRKIDFVEDKRQRLEAFSSELDAISVSADASAFIRTEKRDEPVVLRGFVLEDADRIYKIKAGIYQGEMPRGQSQVLMGRELKEKLGTSVGDRITLSTPSGESFQLAVSGFYDLQVSSINKSWLIVPIRTVQGIFDFERRATAIEMQVKEPFSADTLAKRLQAALADNTLDVEDWKTQNRQLLSGLSGQTASSLMIQVFVLISVVLAIASVLAISVMQKSKQLGILKAMGIKDRAASLIFIFEGLLLGILGALAGAGLGIGLLVMFTTFAVNPDGTPVVPVRLDYYFITASALVAVLSAVLASAIPARRSSRLNPIEVIRNG